MLRQLLKQFQQPAHTHSTHSLELATAALLVEVMHADHTVSASEEQTLLNVLQAVLHLSSDEASSMLAEAKQSVAHAADLQQFTRVVHQHFSHQQLFDLMRGLWLVAYSSNGLDKYEEHMIRRIADLLHLRHSEFIKAKLSARDEHDSNHR